MLNGCLGGMEVMIGGKGKGYESWGIGGFKKEELEKEFDMSERYVGVMVI
ncbi:hypothetical protein [Bacillus subtilis]|nr:hypothetical protein [Bacillus subtilis]